MVSVRNPPRLLIALLLVYNGHVPTYTANDGSSCGRPAIAAFEHTLFMLLLLVGLFTSKTANRWTTSLLITGGILLTLLPPFVRIDIPWVLILELTLPLLFWQNVRHWLRARWRAGWREALLWVFMVLALTLILAVPRYLPITGALLFGLIATGILWRSLEGEDTSNQISQIGPLTLILLLTEIAPFVESPNRYVGGLFSGAAIGIAMALGAGYIGRRLLPKPRAWVALAQSYLAYWLAAFVDVSGVTAALVSAALYAEINLRRPSARSDDTLPAPMDKWPVFAIMLGLFVFLGWQIQIPLNLNLLVEAIAGFFLGFIVALLGRWLRLPNFQRTGGEHHKLPWRLSLRLGLFLLAALALWPRGTLLEPAVLGIALGLAVLLSVVSAIVLDATLFMQKE